MTDPFSTELKPISTILQSAPRTSQVQTQQQQHNTSTLQPFSPTSSVSMLNTPSKSNLLSSHHQQNIPQPVSIPQIHKEQPLPLQQQFIPASTQATSSSTLPVQQLSNSALIPPISQPPSQSKVYPQIYNDQVERGNDTSLACRWGDCTRVFPDPSSLATHLSEDHVGWKKGGYQCDWNNCLRQGVKCHNRFSLMMHLRIHTGEKPFECTTCGQSFGRQDALTRHKKADHGEIVVIENSKAAGTAPTVPTVPPPGTIFTEVDLNNKSTPQIMPMNMAVSPPVSKAAVKQSPVKRQPSVTAENHLANKSTPKKQKLLNTKTNATHKALSTSTTMPQNDKYVATHPASDVTPPLLEDEEKVRGKEGIVHDDEETEDEDFQQLRKNNSKQKAPLSTSLSTSTSNTITASSSFNTIPKSLKNKNKSSSSSSSNNKLLTSKKDSEYIQYRLAKAQLAYLLRENSMLQDEYEVVQKKLERLKTERKILLDALIGQTEPAAMTKKNHIRRTHGNRSTQTTPAIINEEDKSDVDDIDSVDTNDIETIVDDDEEADDDDDDSIVIAD
ncbi:hypothetical protein BDF20DRAFT_835630 [Mycotypha africana]|uniref:uncharacterized protein n=1 Tax=Mycotypha africana TaxID=64632 RepID=UPI0023018429|nr:uncharacterized protein BDF20DRAFT_835630 [Mycotypha africana]KAI8979641.1 hypothetical protein BDF20DRAFT_835630 [Mycotypha africana]